MWDLVRGTKEQEITWSPTQSTKYRFRACWLVNEVHTCTLTLTLTRTGWLIEEGGKGREGHNGDERLSGPQ